MHVESPIRRYLLSGRDARGKRASDEFAAMTSSEALEQARARGWTDILVHTDEIVHCGHGESASKLSAQDQIAILSIGSKSIFRMRLGLLWRSHKGLFLWPIVWSVVLVVLWASRGVRPVDALLVLLVVLPACYLAWVSLRPDPAAPMHRVLEAGLDARWEDVLNLLPRFERSLGKVPSVQSLLHVARLRAGALVKLGRVDEGLRVLRDLESVSASHRALYLWTVGDTLVAARDLDGAEECYLRVIEENPTADIWWAALAEFQATRRERPDAARKSLAMVDRAATTPQSQAYIEFLEGVIALLENHPRRALELLDTAHTHFRERTPDIPDRQAILAFCTAYRAVAQARLGDITGASEGWEQSGRIVTLHGSDLLKQLCSNSIPAARGVDRPVAPFRTGLFDLSSVSR